MIYWAGGEDISVANGKISQVNSFTDAGYYRAGFARCCIQSNLGVGPSYMVQLNGWLGSDSGFGTSDGWASCRVCGSALPSRMLFGIASGPYPYIAVGTSPSDATKLMLYFFNGSSASQIASESGNSYSRADTVYKLDMQFSSLQVNGGGSVKVYWDKQLVMQATGLSFGGNASNCVLGIPGLNANTVGGMSEFIVSDSDTRDMSVVTIVPNGVGSPYQWTGAVTNVNEVVTNDATYDYTSSPSVVQAYNATDMPAGNFTVQAIQVDCRCASPGASPTQMGVGVVQSGGFVAIGPIQGISGLVGNFYSKYWPFQVNQQTGSPWTPADINGLMIAVKSGTS